MYRVIFNGTLHSEHEEGWAACLMAESLRKKSDVRTTVWQMLSQEEQNELIQEELFKRHQQELFMRHQRLIAGGS